MIRTLSARIDPRSAATMLGAILLIGQAGFQPASAADQDVLAGTRTVSASTSFDETLKRLEQAIADNKMGLVASASASRAAAARGVNIPGNAVLMVFRNDFAVRMLEASIPAGIEAPLRLYVTEAPAGAVSITYRLPSAVFAPWKNDALDAVAAELDPIIDSIVNDAIR